MLRSRLIENRSLQSTVEMRGEIDVPRVHLRHQQGRQARGWFTFRKECPASLFRIGRQGKTWPEFTLDNTGSLYSKRWQRCGATLLGSVNTAICGSLGDGPEMRRQQQHAPRTGVELNSTYQSTVRVAHDGRALGQNLRVANFTSFSPMSALEIATKPNQLSSDMPRAEGLHTRFATCWGGETRVGAEGCFSRVVFIYIDQ